VPSRDAPTIRRFETLRPSGYGDAAAARSGRRRCRDSGLRQSVWLRPWTSATAGQRVRTVRGCIQLGLVIVAMDTTESVPLVEAAIVSVLPVNIDLNELHPRGTGEARSTLRGEPHLCPGLASSARRKARQAGRRARHTRRWSVTSQVRTRPPALQPAMPPCCRQQEGRSGDQQGRPGQARDRRTRH